MPPQIEPNGKAAAMRATSSDTLKAREDAAAKVAADDAAAKLDTAPVEPAAGAAIPAWKKPRGAEDLTMLNITHPLRLHCAKITRSEQIQQNERQINHD